MSEQLKNNSADFNLDLSYLQDVANGSNVWRVAFPDLLTMCNLVFIVNSLQAAFGTAQSVTG